MSYKLSDITGKRAIAWIEQTHRHLPELQGALFAVSVKHHGEVVGVATAGNPPRVWQGTGRFVITRCAVLSDLPGYGDHPAPACSMLYSALVRAGEALGYGEAWTYTLPHEHGRSLLAAGFLFMGFTKAEQWSRPSRPREPAVNADRKARWARGCRRENHRLLKLKALDPAILISSQRNAA